MVQSQMAYWKQNQRIKVESGIVWIYKNINENNGFVSLLTKSEKNKFFKTLLIFNLSINIKPQQKKNVFF